MWKESLKTVCLGRDSDPWPLRSGAVLYQLNQANRPFSKIAATYLNELKLNWMKNWYHHFKEHLYFSNLAKFQHIRCYISLENVRWNLTNLTGGIRHTPSHTNVCKFLIFQLACSQLILPLIMLKLCRVTEVKVFFLVLVYVFNFNLFEFAAAILEKGLLGAG